MRKLSVREMRAALGNLDELVGQSGEVIVTRHGEPIARILPIRGTREIPSLRAFRASMPLCATSSEELVREDRDARG
jgi:prevent-host-death family protein